MGLAVVAVAIAACDARAKGFTDTGVVERVIDGDTLVVRGVGTVRLIGVDTPETVHPRKPTEAFGREATDFLKTLVGRQLVRLEHDGPRIDRFGRVLAYVYLQDGTFVNAEIVRQGYGHAYTQFPFKHLEEFRELEREAREQRRGLWREEPIVAARTVAPAPARHASSARANERTPSTRLRAVAEGHGFDRTRAGQ